MRQRAVNVSANYGDFGPKLAGEYLEEKHGLKNPPTNWCET